MPEQNTTIIDARVLPEVKKAIDLFIDKTYEVQEFYSHILQIIRDNSDTGDKHKEQLERLIFKVDELRSNQRKFYAGHKQLLGTCRSLEQELDKKLFHLQGQGYSITRFKKEQPKQQQFF